MNLPYHILCAWAMAAALCLASGPAAAARYLNKEIEIKGQWHNGIVEVSTIRLTTIPKGPTIAEVRGDIRRLDRSKRQLFIGPFEIRWSAKTEFDGLIASELKVGRGIKVRGRILAAGRLAALSIKPRSSYGDSIRLRGTVTAERKLRDRSLLVSVLGVDVRIPKKAVGRAETLTRRPDQRRPSEQFTTVIAGRPLTIGGEYRIELDDRVDRRLGTEPDDERTLEQELQVEFFYPFTEEVSGFAEIVAFDQREIDIEAARPKQSITELRRGEMWVYVDRFLGKHTALQAGRQDFRERREWWWDEELDAVRLRFDDKDLHMELALARELAKVSSEQDFIDPEREDVTWLIGHVNWQWRKRQLLELFLLDQGDDSSAYTVGQPVTVAKEDEVDADLHWYGIRARGKAKFKRAGRLNYWIDTAWVSGDETDYDFTGGIVDDKDTVKIDGSAIDLGASWSTRLPGEPAFTIAYAKGSGDPTGADDTDESFRQTGLNDNNGRFFGVNRFRYYGEVLRPDLSNLRILTLAYGQSLGVRSSMEIVYHDYKQVYADNDIRNARMRLNPLGVNTDIGEELDLVFGFRKWRHVDIEAVFGVFRAGDAFGVNSGDTSRLVNLEFTYSF